MVKLLNINDTLSMNRITLRNITGGEMILLKKRETETIATGSNTRNVTY